MEKEMYKNVYFLGIGGIGMSALARYFNTTGACVSGYDRMRTFLTDQLSDEGIRIHYEEDTGKIPGNIDLVIYTPAIPSDSKELLFLRHSGKKMMKRSEALGMIASDYKVIAVAGTHGKTTTSSMITYILSKGGIKLTAFIGGIAGNFKTNFVYSEDAEYMIVEADEYDRSFLTLYPQIEVVTSMDADHLDIYGKKEMLTDSFMKFCEQLQAGGTLLIRKNLPFPVSLFSRVKTYSAVSPADFYALNIKKVKDKMVFDMMSGEGHIHDITLGVPGRHNVENATVAAAVACLMGVETNVIRDALAGFTGVQRRFEYRINSPELVYIDDYAHHPRELDAFIGAVKEMYPGRKVTGIFQPHLYSRTKDFADEFADCLSVLDELILLEIYPARELPIRGVNSQFLLEKVRMGNKKLMSKDELLKYINEKKFDVLLTIGAGDIDQLTGPIEKSLKSKLT